MNSLFSLLCNTVNAETALTFVNCRGLCAGYLHRLASVCLSVEKAMVRKSLSTTYYVDSFLVMFFSFPSIISLIKKAVLFIIDL